MIKGEGLLWLPEAVTVDTPFVWQMRQAVRCFREKFSARPTVCRMRASDVPEGVKTVAGIKIVPDETITSGHWFFTAEVLDDEKV